MTKKELEVFNAFFNKASRAHLSAIRNCDDKLVDIEYARFSLLVDIMDALEDVNCSDNIKSE